MGQRNAGFVRAGFRRGNNNLVSSTAQFWVDAADPSVPAARVVVAGTDYVAPGGVSGGQTVSGGTATAQSLVLKANTSAGVATWTLTNVGTAQSAILAATVNDVVSIGATNSSAGNQASVRVRMTNDAGNQADFALYGTGHSNASFANRLSINAYSATAGAQIMADAAAAFFRISLGTGSLSLSGETNERFRVTTTFVQVGDGNTANFKVTSATGTTVLTSGAQLGVGGTPTGGYAVHVQTSTTTAQLLVDQTTAAQDAAARIYAQSNAGGTTAELSMFNSSATGTLAGVNKANRAYVYCVGGTQIVVGGHTSCTLGLAAGGAIAATVDASQNVGIGLTPANNARLEIAKGTVTSTSATQRGTYLSATFAPTSGTAVFIAENIVYTVNQTGGANGAVDGLLIEATQTAAVGTHHLLRLTKGGNNVFRVLPAQGGADGLVEIRADTEYATFGKLSFSWQGAQKGYVQCSSTGLVELGSNGAAGTGQVLIYAANGTVLTGMSTATSNAANLAIFDSGGVGFGGGKSVISIKNANTDPTTNPTGGGILYCSAGALKYRGSSGTVTTLGAA